MRSIKDQLADMSEESVRWAKITSRNTDSGRKTSYSRRYYVQTDFSFLNKMLDQVSKTADRIAFTMLEKMDHYTNIYSGTYQEIQDRLGTSNKTVTNAMVELQQVDFMRKYRNGRWMVNPAVGIGCSEEFLTKLQDTYFSLRPYTPKNERGTNCVTGTTGDEDPVL